MKKFYSSSLFLATVLAVTFTACKKDETVVADTTKSTNTTTTNTTTGGSGTTTGGSGTTTGGSGTTTGGSGTTTGGSGTTTGGSGTTTGGSGTTTGGSGTTTGGSGTTTGGSGTTVTDTQNPFVRVLSPTYGAILGKSKDYTLTGTVSDDVALYQVVVQIRLKNTSSYVLNKTITLPAGVKTYSVSENFTTPNFAGQGYYIVSITGVDKMNKKSAGIVEIVIN